MNTEPCSSLESSGRFDLLMVVEGLLTMMITLVLGWSIAGLVIGFSGEGGALGLASSGDVGAVELKIAIGLLAAAVIAALMGAW